MDDGFTPGYDGDGGGSCEEGEWEMNDDGVCEVCAFWRELASFKHKADGAKQFPVAASDDILQSIPREVGGHLRNMIPESEPDKLQEKYLHIFRSTEQGYGACKPHDRAPVKLRVGLEPLSSNLGGSYILQRRTTLPLQAKKKVEEKVQAIRPKLPIFVKVMTRSSVDSTGCKTCEIVFCSEYGECLPNKSRRLVLQLEGKERQWQATLDIRTDICISQRRISKGWKEFSRQNGLEVGDICLFKLEDTNTTSLKMTVYLIRKSQIEL